jgi:hypothetical protein
MADATKGERPMRNRNERWMKALLCAVFIGVLSAGSSAEAQFLKRLFGGSTTGTSLGEPEIRDGLKEALRIGTDKAVAQVGREDGYFANPKIKIPLPSAVDRMDRALRAVGYGPQLDEFQLSMNRAAEKAAPEAKKIFVDAISQLTIADAQDILKGSDTAATEYFKKTTTEPLTEKFTPIIRSTMSEFGVVQQYEAIVARYQDIPFVRQYTEGSVEEYTTEKALEGLFYMVGEEEKKIRQDPAARTTELLKKVFGQ